ncbi:iron-containing redox enzyme family protein [Streptomyces sp. NPDC018031]|uniref:iron-containing redox enzyme family protein n=1 Tax=Streptomyces sp. NPDC018031 TaxID=3365033 RepID=UPI003789315A
MTATAPSRPARPRAPRLPEPRGTLSATVLRLLRSPPGTAPPRGVRPDGDDPFGEDLQLALHLCYELHYRGFPEADDGWEWDPGLLRLRAAAERRFLDGLRAATAGGADVGAALDALLVEPVHGTGISHYLRDEGGWEQMREYLVHRSLYHLKEADPHAWAVPRLQGRAKAALVAVEFDEFGGGRADRMHSRLFRDLLAGAGLDPGYLHYLDAVPAPPIAVVNMMSLFGLHRALRGALVGHFAAAEITTGPSARRMAQGLRRLGAPEACVRFYTEHIEADAVHEQLMRHEVIADLLRREPALAPDVVLGIQATELVEDRLAGHLRACWDRGAPSLRHPLPPPGRP